MLLPLAKALLGAAALGVLVAVALAAMFLVGSDLHASKVTAGVLGAETWDPRTGEWSAAGAIDEPRVAPELVRLGDGRVLVAGGFWEATPATKALLWSPAARAFEEVGSPEIETQCQTAIVLTGDRLLFASSSEADNWGIGAFHASLYDATSAKWSRVAMSPDRGVRALASLDDARTLFVFASHASVWNRDTLAWTQGPGVAGDGSALDCARAARAQTLADGRVLVVSKVLRAGTEGWAWLWAPQSGALVSAGAFEKAVAAADPAHAGDETEIDALSLASGGGVVLLGERAVYVANAGLDSVSAVPLPADQSGGAAALIGGRVVLAGGGRDGSFSTKATTIDLTTKQVARTGSLAAARWGASAVVLADGRVLVVGGAFEQWDVSWGRFAVLFALGTAVLAAFAGVVAVARRSGRRWTVVAVALVACSIVGGGAFWMLLAAIGSAIKG